VRSLSRFTILALPLIACTGADTDTEELPAWQTVADDLGGALLAVTGTTADDVWAVGADDGSGPLVLHWDGTTWERLDTGTTGDLWWAWRPPEASRTNDLWASGAGGRILRFDGEAWHEAVLDATEVVFWGIWGASEEEVWTIGGDPTVSSDGAVLYRANGGTWAEEALPADAASQFAMYKVWGAAADDVWACGANGAMMHWDGAAWTDVESGTDRLLLTVAGTGSDDVWAVGGTGSGEIVHWDGASWTSDAPEFSVDFNGVSARDDLVVAVGRVGDAWLHGAEGWIGDPRGRATFKDLHATWIDPDGGVWAVGGQISALPMTGGVMVYAGEQQVATYSE
jgi:hypothetical protein